MADPRPLRLEIRFDEKKNQYVRSLFKNDGKTETQIMLDDVEFYMINVNSVVIEATQICLNEICSVKCEKEKCLKQLFHYNMNRKIVVNLRVESQTTEELWELIINSFQFMILTVRKLDTEQIRQLALEQRCHALEIEDEIDFSELEYDMLIEFQDLYFHKIKEDDGAVTKMFKKFLQQMKKKKHSGNLEFLRESETTTLTDLVLQKNHELGLKELCSHRSFAFYKMSINTEKMLLVHVGTPFILTVVEKKWPLVIAKIVELTFGSEKEAEALAIMESSGLFAEGQAAFSQEQLEDFFKNLWDSLSSE